MTTSTIHQGDSLLILPTLPAASADAVITDPPYNSGGRTQAERTTRSAVDKYVSGDAAGPQAIGDFAGDNRDQRSYTRWLAVILAECLRTAADGAPLLVFTDWRQLPATSDALQIAGWTWRGIVPWHKPVARPQIGGFRRSCEYVLWATNGPIDAARNPVYLDGWYSFSQPRGRDRFHITAKPLALMRELVKVCPPDGTVLDPFAGSGSTGVAALAEGRSFVGIEATTRYAAVARRRLGSALDAGAQLGLA